MRLNGRRESNNVEDRRGLSSGAKAGIGGLGGIIVILLMTFLSGGNIGDAVVNILQNGGIESLQEEQPADQRAFTKEEEDSGGNRGCVDRGLPPDGASVSAPHPGTLHQQGKQCLRVGISCRRSVLLFG